MGGWGRDPFSRNFMKPTPRRKWYLTTGRSFHEMVLDPIPQSLLVHFFGSRPQPPTSPDYPYASRRIRRKGICRLSIIGCLILTGPLSQKSPVISGSFAENYLQPIVDVFAGLQKGICRPIDSFAERICTLQKGACSKKVLALNSLIPTQLIGTKNETE